MDDTPGSVRQDENFISFSSNESRRTLHEVLLAIAGSIMGGWVLGASGLSIAWVLLLLATVIIKWNAQLDLLMRKVKWEEMQRIRKQRALANSETAEWLNVLLHKWCISGNENFFRIIRSKIEPLLNDVKPPFVERIELKEFTLGDQTPCIQNIRCFEIISGVRRSVTSEKLLRPLNRKQLIELEVAVIFNSEQFRMVFCARMFGKGVGIDVDIALEKLHVCGKMGISLTLDSNSAFPHISKVSISFLEKPDVWFSVKVMKSLQMMEVPILKTWLHSIVVDALESALVNPGQISFHLGGNKLNTPTPDGENSSTLAQGVLIVSLTSLPDYVNDGDQKWMVLRLGDQVWRTCPISPQWTETPHFLVSALSRDRLVVKLKSKRLVTSTTLAQYEMVLDDYNLETTPSVETHLQKRNPRLSQIPSISLRLGYVPLPSLTDDDFPPSPQTPPSIVSGVLTVIVHSARGLVSNDSSCNPYCIVFNNRKKVKSTSYVVNAVNPQWQSKCQMLVTDYNQTSLSFVVCSWNLKKMTDDEMLGVSVLNLSRDNLWARTKEITLSGSPGATLIISYNFVPVCGMCGDANAVSEDEDGVLKRSSVSWMHQAKSFLGRIDQETQSGSDITNIVASGTGLMEVALISARDLMPMDLNGFSDPYCELKVNHECKYKSSVKKKTLNPVWEENVIMPIPRLGETFEIMVWDHDNFGMKDFLGNVNFNLDDVRTASSLNDTCWYRLKGVRSGEIQLRIKIISEDSSSFERDSLKECSVESSPILRKSGKERSRVRLGVNVPPPTPPRTVSIPRPPALGRDARDSPELTLPLLTVNDSPIATRASSQASSHQQCDSLPPSPVNEPLDSNKKLEETSGFRSMRLKVSRSLRLRRFRSEVNVRHEPPTDRKNLGADSLNHAVSQPDISKPPVPRPTELNLSERRDTYSGVEGRVIQAQGLHVAHITQLYARIKILGCHPRDKQGIGKTIAKSHLLPAVPNPQFQLEFQISNPETVPRQAALLFEIRSSSKEILALRRVTLQDLLPGDLKETHTWLALNNGATLEVFIGHGHIIKKKSRKLFRSWSVHRIGKI